MYSLVRNEFMKMLGNKRLYITLGILVIIVFLVSYGQYSSLDRTKTRLAQRAGVESVSDWKKLANQQLIDLKVRMESPYVDADRMAFIKARMDQLRYYIENNINPIDLNSASFTTRFIELTIFLFIPLLIIILTADIVSGEFTAGTIKLLLVRPVPRWKILLAKYLCVHVLLTVVLFFSFVLSFVISGFFFGFGGWSVPVATGFQVVAGKLVTAGVTNVPQWFYTLMAYGLAYYVAATVATVSFMISVLVRSTAASIGVILAALVSGSFMSAFAEDWVLPRYLFTSNLRLIEYISGSLRPIEGMDLGFSLAVLGGWSIMALVVSFTYFTKREVLV